MFVAGIDAHATYSAIAIVSNTGELVHKAVRIKNSEQEFALLLRHHCAGLNLNRCLVQSPPDSAPAFDMKS